MKYLQLLFLVMIRSLCAAQETHDFESTNPAAADVNAMILEAEKELEAHENGTSGNIFRVHALIALSKIYPKMVDGTYFGILYRPSHEEILLWKEWYNKNRFYLSYDPLNERYEGLLDNEKIIVLTLPDGTIRKSRTEEELDSLEKIYQHTLNNKNKTKK